MSDLNEKLEKSVLTEIFSFEYPIEDENLESAQNYIESFDLNGPLSLYLKRKKELYEFFNVKIVDLIFKDSKSFVAKVYTSVNLTQVEKEKLDFLADSLERAVFKGFAPQFNDKPFGKVSIDNEIENHFQYGIMNESKLTEDAHPKSEIKFTCELEEPIPSDKFEKAKDWFEFASLIHSLDRNLNNPTLSDNVLSIEIELPNPDCFIVKTEIDGDLINCDKEIVDAYCNAIRDSILNTLVPAFHASKYGKVETKNSVLLKNDGVRLEAASQLHQSQFKALEGKEMEKVLFEPNKSFLEQILGTTTNKEIRDLFEAAAPTEEAPLKVECPRGDYYVWQQGTTIYGSATKPDPGQRIVNARSITNFTSQGFEDVDEVVAYCKKYF